MASIPGVGATGGRGGGALACHMQPGRAGSASPTSRASCGGAERSWEGLVESQAPGSPPTTASRCPLPPGGCSSALQMPAHGERRVGMPGSPAAVLSLSPLQSTGQGHEPRARWGLAPLPGDVPPPAHPRGRDGHSRGVSSPGQGMLQCGMPGGADRWPRGSHRLSESPQANALVTGPGPLPSAMGRGYWATLSPTQPSLQCEDSRNGEGPRPEPWGTAPLLTQGRQSPWADVPCLGIGQSLERPSRGVKLVGVLERLVWAAEQSAAGREEERESVNTGGRGELEPARPLYPPAHWPIRARPPGITGPLPPV